MKRLLIYLFAIISFVGCEAPLEPNVDPQPEPKPVRPIKPRPIVPDGTILRPRIDGILTGITILLPTYNHPDIYNVHVQCEQSGEEYYGICEVKEGYIVVPRIGYNERLTITLDDGEEKFTFTVDEIVE